MKLKTNSSTINSIFSLVVDKELFNNFNFKVIKTEAKDFFDKEFKNLPEDEKLILEEEISNFSFSDLSNYINKGNNRVFKLAITLSVFKEELLKLLSVDSLEEEYNKIDFGKFERKVSPPLGAYEYKGNNILKITPTKRSYGLLFE